MPKVSVTNLSQAPQGFYAGGEIETIQPKMARDLLMTDDEAKQLSPAQAGGLVKFTVIDKTANPGDPAPLNALGDRDTSLTSALLDDGTRASVALSDPRTANEVLRENVDGGGENAFEVAAPDVRDGTPYPTESFPLEKFDRDQLAALIATETGQRPHPNTSDENLLKKAQLIDLKPSASEAV